jgi:hypothetical protein
MTNPPKLLSYDDRLFIRGPKSFLQIADLAPGKYSIIDIEVHAPHAVIFYKHCDGSIKQCVMDFSGMVNKVLDNALAGHELSAREIKAVRVEVTKMVEDVIEKGLRERFL